MAEHEPLPKSASRSQGLTKYIDENGKLLTALGAFLGLSVFMNKLSPEFLTTLDQPTKWVIKFISFLFFSIAFIVLLEMVKNLYHFELSGLLRWFEELLFVAFVGFSWIWYKMYSPFLKTGVIVFVILLVVLLLFALLQWLIRKASSRALWLSTTPHNREVVIPAIGSLVIMFGILFALFYYLR
jgi:hypothetical protein